MDDVRDEGLLRALVPQVITALLLRGADFAAAEDAVRAALIDALRTWPENQPRRPPRGRRPRRIRTCSSGCRGT